MLARSTTTTGVRRRPPSRTGILGGAALVVVGASVWITVDKGIGQSEDTTSADPSTVNDRAAQVSGRIQLRVVNELAGIQFTHVAEANHELAGIMSGGGGFLDYDGDGYLDIFLVQSGHLGQDQPDSTSRLYRNNGDGTFTDVTDESGAGVGGFGMGCAAADIDGDGDVDLYITRVGEDVLLVNDGHGGFVDQTAAAGLATPGFSTSAAFFDIDQDGLADLYVARYVRVTPSTARSCFGIDGDRDFCNPTVYPAQTDRLYRNLGNGRFEDITRPAGIDAVAGYGLGLLASDFDGDGFIDIYVANDQSPAFLWHNRGDGTFDEIAVIRGCAFNDNGEAIAGMGTAAADFDADGDLDLFVTNINHKSNLFLRNSGGMFEDVSRLWGDFSWLVPFTGFGTVAVDLDVDGTRELLIANGAVARAGSGYGQPDQLLQLDTNGTFRDISGSLPSQVRQPAISRGVAHGDYDNDGDIDLLVMRNNGPALLVRNDQQSSNHWLIVRTESARASGSVLNTRIVVDDGRRRHIAEVRPHDSYLSTSDPRLHFGLGDATSVRLIVSWPDGLTEAFADVGVDQIFTVRRGSGETVAGP